MRVSSYNNIFPYLYVCILGVPACTHGSQIKSIAPLIIAQYMTKTSEPQPGPQAQFIPWFVTILVTPTLSPT